jgi:outer membrane lipoprotein LolB
MTYMTLHEPTRSFTAIIKIFLLMCFALLLSACSTPKPLSSAQLNQARTLQEQIQLQGRISIQYQENDQPQTVIVGFDWQQTPQELHINLTSSFGQTIATIQQNAFGARLEQAKQAPRIAADIESLLAENLGWTIPVAGLKAWLQGFDLSPNGRAIALPATDYLRLQSQGWQIDFVSWQADAEIVHPKRIDLYKNTEQVGEMKIRIVIEE